MKEYLKKAVIVGLALIATGVIRYSTRSIWGVFEWVIVIAGAVLVVASVAVKSGEIRAGLGRRSSRFGINSAASVLFLLGILVFVNYLGAQHVKRVDTTSEKIYSLSDQSATVAQQIKQDLKIKAFSAGGDYPHDKDPFELYKARNNKISF